MVHIYFGKLFTANLKARHRHNFVLPLEYFLIVFINQRHISCDSDDESVSHETDSLVGLVSYLLH